MKKEREDNLAFDRVDYIQSKNLMNENVVYGFGSNKLCIKEIDRNVANGIIKKNHYSKKYYQLSYIHLGVYSDNVLCGVLQFGYAMNPASGCKVVKNTANDEYLELNRMWISDVMPRNTESMVMSYSIKYIKKKYPKVNWIQSFADERCGGLEGRWNKYYRIIKINARSIYLDSLGIYILLIKNQLKAYCLTRSHILKEINYMKL